MKKSDGARRLIPAALLPGAALVLMTGVSSAAPIFHFANYTYLHEEDFSYIWNRLHSGDFNGDSLPDFVLGSWVSDGEGFLRVFLGNGDGTFQALDHVVTRSINVWAVGDFDNNGLDDVLIKDYDYDTSSSRDTARCYLSVGGGWFADPIDVPGFLRAAGGYFYRTDVADYDNDGNLDIALGAIDTVEVYLGAGDGTFARSWGVTIESGASVASGDLDNDDLLDLITTGYGFFRVFPGLGDGTFGDVSAAGYFIGPGFDVCCGDFDEDGWNDIAVAACRGIGWDSFHVFHNKEGTFPPQGDSYIDSWAFENIFCEDLNLDGHLDLGASTGDGWGAAMILGGVGDGTFNDTELLWHVWGCGGQETARGDFDGDGDPDMAVISTDDYYPQYPPGVYVIPNETNQHGVEGGESAPGLPTLTPSINPFTSSLTITCEGETLPEQLTVCDLSGRLIATLSDRQGSCFIWDGRDGSGMEVPVGAYLIRGVAAGRTSSLRVVRL